MKTREQLLAEREAIDAQIPAMDVDPLLIEARNLVASMPTLNALQADAYRRGDWDAGGSVDLALAALRRGMELSRAPVAEWPSGDVLWEMANACGDDAYEREAALEMAHRLRAHMTGKPEGGEA